MKLSAIPAGKTYNEYILQWKERLKIPMKGLSVDERKTLLHRKYNWDRAATVDNFFIVGEETRKTIALVPKQEWVLITEDWCLDSAFHVATITKVGALNKNISLRIIERDQHPDIMDNYLTNGGRAIPILVVFNELGTELFHFGPRTKAAKDARQQMVDKGLDKNEISSGLLDFYLNKGWEHIEAELLALLKKTLVTTKPD